MLDTKSIMKLLQVGATRNDFPLYGQYLKSEDKVLYTCNSDVYVQINHDIGFEGITNFFILNNMIQSAEEYKIIQLTGSIGFQSANLQSKLNLVKFKDFPKLDLSDHEFTVVDEILLNVFKNAIRFTGTENDSIICTGDHLYGTDGSMMYHYDVKDYDLDGMCINKSVVSILREGDEIAVDHNSNIVVKLNEAKGYATFTTQFTTLGFIEMLNNTLRDSTIDIKKLCNMKGVKDSTAKILPILLNETQNPVEFFNKNNKLKLTCVSDMDGKATSNLVSNNSAEFSFFLDSKLYAKIHEDFDMYTSSRPNTVLFKHGDATIILRVLMGV